MRVMPPVYANVYCDAAHEPRFEHSIVNELPGSVMVRICCAQPDGQLAVSVHGKSHTSDSGVALGPAGGGMIGMIDMPVLGGEVATGTTGFTGAIGCTAPAPGVAGAWGAAAGGSTAGNCACNRRRAESPLDNAA